MNRSSKYGFYLPQNSDPISVSDFNYNFGLIDENLITESQSLTSTQKSTARANIEAASQASVSESDYACTVNTNYCDSSNSTIKVYKFGRFGLITGYLKVTTTIPEGTEFITLGGGVKIYNRPCYAFLHGYDNTVKGRVEAASGSASLKASGGSIPAYSSYMYISIPFITD